MITTPKRIQRKRIRNWRMPSGAVYVGRGSRWGNPHKISDYNDFRIAYQELHKYLPRIITDSMCRLAAADAYRRDLNSGDLDISADDIQRELRGKDLACWCALDELCHADVLLEIANR